MKKALIVILVLLVTGCAITAQQVRITGFDIYRDAEGNATGYVEHYEMISPAQDILDLVGEAL